MGINYVKANLEIFIPSLVELVSGMDFPWDKIERGFNHEIERRKLEGKGEPLIVEATIYDIMIEAKKGNLTALGHLSFLKKLFEELCDLLSMEEKILARTTVKKMLTAMDQRHRTFLAELATLNNLVKTKRYKLTGIEAKLPNGKRIDFKINDIYKQREILIEVDNIFLNSEKIDDDPILIEKFLKGRANQKLCRKTITLQRNQDFYIVPVLWGPASDLKIYSNFFKTHSVHTGNYFEPLAYLTYSNSKGNYEHYFGRVSTLF
jgi:hypothetical protein